MSLSLSIPLPPSVNAMYFNRKFATGGRGRGRTQKYKDWLDYAGWSVRSQSGGWSCSGPWSLEIMAVKPDSRRRDIDNLIKPVCDLLVSLRIVPDDSEMRSVSARWLPHGELNCECRVFVFNHSEVEM